MPTRRLFDEDSHLCEFESRIVALRPDGPWIALEETAFYPEEGGQRPDRGNLSGVPVVDLAIDEDRTIWHRLESDPGWTSGQNVAGHVDPAIRRAHRQQHTGQHLLSRAFVEVLGAETRAFHMGEETSTIDIENGEIDFERLRAVEEIANAVVVEDHPVIVTETPRPGGTPLRMVSVQGFDEQHCCGTHVKATGEVGLIKVLRWEKVKGMTRVHFVCGDRSLRAFQGLLEATDGAARALSAAWSDLPRAWQERWALLEAGRIARETNRQVDGTFFVAAWIDGADAATLRAAANALLEEEKAAVILAGPGEPGKRPWIVARTGDLPAGRSLDARAVLADILAPLGGKGGGSPSFAQGTCPADEDACRVKLLAIRASA